MIGVIGEILVDMIGKKENGVTSYSRYAGGAPFNLTCCAKKLGADVLFHGIVGKDVMGEFLVETSKSHGLDPSYIYLHPDFNTTLALVSHDERGERSFCFYRKHTADDAFLDEIPEAFFSANILHFGTLMLSSSHGRSFLKKQCEEAKKRGQLISFDVNYRSDLYASEEEALSFYRYFLPLGDILKFSEDEVKLFGEDYVSSFPNKIVVVTEGEDGSRLLYQGKTYSAPSISVKPLDTTGAGDAFFGAFLTKLDGKKLDTMSQKQIEDLLRFSNIVAALNTTCLGAIDGLPSLEKVQSLWEENQ